VEAGRDYIDMTHTRLHDGRAVDTRAFISQGSEPSRSDDEKSRLSDSDPDVSSDGDGCSSEDELGCSGTRMNIPWDPVDEQRLLAYKKEGKPWKWIFRQFLGRTQAAVRTRLNIVRKSAIDRNTMSTCYSNIYIILQAPKCTYCAHNRGRFRYSTSS